MQPNDQLLPLICELLTRDLPAPQSDLPNVSADSWAMLQQLVAERVAYWIAFDMERLLSSLYRLDVSEKKFNYIWENAPPKERVAQITELILAREIEKAKTRLAYRTYMTDPKNTPLNPNSQENSEDEEW